MDGRRSRKTRLLWRSALHTPGRSWIPFCGQRRRAARQTGLTIRAGSDRQTENEPASTTRQRFTRIHSSRFHHALGTYLNVSPDAYPDLESKLAEDERGDKSLLSQVAKQ
jgi:hypothetical protein